ncbi:hypothetical protein [Rhizobium leguminosarum]|uniref:hypothetical protein n=1 Tax=Rhizobium leguminosarum TaxID=384 RepID=UPI00103D0EF1|nr:hypothetical protein [Rhizobium leguminosarum]TBZ97438.1 hypothetical protein E0H63_29525 [Rhizobium leguminosarum bv. viciae]
MPTSIIISRTRIRSEKTRCSAAGCRSKNPSEGLPNYPRSPGITRQPQAPGSKATTAPLQLAMQLHHQRATGNVLDGRALVLDDDGFRIERIMNRHVLQPDALRMDHDFNRTVLRIINAVAEFLKDYLDLGGKKFIDEQSRLSGHGVRFD